jgi:hypothetical protein
VEAPPARHADVGHRARGRDEIAAGPGILRHESLRDIDTGERLDRLAGVGDGHAPHLPVAREHHGPIRLTWAAVPSAVEHHGRPGPPPGGDEEDVPLSQGEPGLLRGIAPFGRGPAVDVLFPAGQRLPQLGVLPEVAQVAGHRLPVPVAGLLDPAQLRGEADDGPVGLELRERRLQDLPGGVPAHAGHEIDGHVVRGLEGGPQRVGARRRKAGQRPRVESRLPQHDGVSLDVDAAAASSPGQLGVLARRQIDVRFAIPLDQALEDDGLGRHVDAEREGLRREDDLDHPELEQVLDDLLENGQEPGVMRGKAALECLEPLIEAEGGEVLVRQFHRGGQRRGPDVAALVRRRQAQAGVQALAHGLVAAGPAEQEVDRRQQAIPLEPLHHLAAPWGLGSAAPLTVPRSAAAAGAATVVTVLLAGQSHQVGVDDVLVVVDEQVVHPGAGHDVLPQRHRSVLLHHDGRLSSNGGEPRAELLRVAHRGGQRDHGDGLREMDDHLLPHGAAEAVGEVVHLVHDDVSQAPERRGARVEHVAQHLRGHHHDRSLAVDAVVAGEQPDARGTVPGDEVVVLLVGQRLDRRRVEALAALGQGEVDGELADNGLAGPRGRCHQHAEARLQRLAGAHLEVVEAEDVPGREGAHF